MRIGEKNKKTTLLCFSLTVTVFPHLLLTCFFVSYTLFFLI